MAVTVKNFGKTKDGKDISLFTIKNANGMEASISNFGGVIVSLVVPNKDGEFKDVVLGFEKGEDYYNNGCFFGATIGRSSNRIKNATCVIDGVQCNFPVNDGPNNLHTDIDEGFHKQLFDAEVLENGVKLTYTAPDMLAGFPGNLKTAVTFTLSDDNALSINYDAVSDKTTVINLTNHSYFNLAGHNSGSIYDTELQINASKYVPVLDGAIPTGEEADVEGTVFDFRTLKKIGKEIDEDVDQLKVVGGYDHNYAIDGYDKSQKLIAVAKADGRTMEVYTDLPGVQFYAGNFIEKESGKDGATYTKRTGFCLETQYFPDSVNQENFLTPIFKAGEAFKSTTVYKFV